MNLQTNSGCGRPFRCLRTGLVSDITLLDDVRIMFGGGVELLVVRDDGCHHELCLLISNQNSRPKYAATP